jgi:serine/threonine-protein kinase
VVASRYEIEARLGKGGMGTVYRARDLMLGEQVALKVLNSDLATTPDMGERFRSEIRLARRVTHRNVCRIHDYGEEGPLRFISMQLIDGEDLRQVLRRRGGLPPEEAFEVAIQAADGLQAIHDEGIIHRDLKSPNIMRDGRGVARLMDFGIAKQWQEGIGGGLTLTGQIVGTPEYMSPEQVRGEKLDFRSDVYALGIVVFELFTGQVPFKGDTTIATIMMQLEAPPPLEGERARGIPEPVLPVLRKALAKDPAERHGSVRELGEALRLARAAAFAQLSPAAAATAPSPGVVTGAVTAVPPAVPVTASSEPASVPTPATAVPVPRLTQVPAGTARIAATAVPTLAPAPSPPDAAAQREARRPSRLGWWLGLAAAGVVAGGLLWVNRPPPVKGVESPPPPTLEPIPEPEPTTTPRQTTPSPGPEPPGPSVSSAPSVTPKPPTTVPGSSTPGGVDLSALDQLAREDPEAALARVRDLERQRPGDSALGERRIRYQAQMGAQALEQARRTVAQAQAEESLELYGRAIQGFTRAVELDPGSAEARRALGEAVEGEARLKARRALVSFVLSETTITGVTPHVVNAPPGMGEAPPGVIVKRAEATPLKAKIVIETEPSQVKKGEQVTVRYYLENQTAGPLHVSDALVQTVTGQGATTGGKIQPQTKLAEPRGKALLLESRDAWRLDPGTDLRTMLRVVLADGTVLTASLQARR